MKTNTLAVHAGRKDLTYAHVPSIDLSTTYKTPDLDDATNNIDTIAAGNKPTSNGIYQRLHNPTVARFEGAFAKLEGAEEAMAFASGMAAITAVLLAAKMQGNHVVAVRPLYGGTDHLLACGLLGLDVSWATQDTVAEHIRPDTALIICETPANPNIRLIDIEHVVAQASGVAVMVDSTFATPILQQPIKHGATIVVHSGTKFIGGHGDIMAGIVACNLVWAQKIRQVRILTGGNLHPVAAYNLHRGLQTLALRVRGAQANARILAKRLVKHPQVHRVLYPEAPGGDPRKLLGRQLKGPGSMLSIELKGGYDAARMVMSEVQLITPAVSLGSCDSLIQHPAGLTHRLVDETARANHGIGPGMLRISVGIEDVEDLWQDLENALASIGETVPCAAK